MAASSAPGVQGTDIRRAAVVLAAGAGSRFSERKGAKLLASLDGRPILAHVLDAVRAFGPTLTIVVLGHGREAIEAAIDWTDELRVVNPHPERGLASSLQAGFRALASAGREMDSAFIVLGDQPLLRPEVMAALAEAAQESMRTGRARAVFAPRYAEGRRTEGGTHQEDAGPRNPVLLLRAAWPLIEKLQGDRGLGPLLAEPGAAVLEVPVTGSQPDVDTPDDLAAIARVGAARAPAASPRAATPGADKRRASGNP